MDKEAEKIYTLIEDRVMTKTLHTGGQIDELTVEILQSLKERYHKQPSSPPVLSDEELDQAYCLADLKEDKFGHKAIAQAQRDADVEYYTGGKQ